MPSDVDPAGRGRVADLMRALMVENALHHRGENPFRSVDPFSAAVLEGHGLLAVTEVAQPPGDVLPVLANPDHPSRMAVRPGPLVFVRDGDRGSVIDPSELLADEVPEVRLAAVRYFEALPVGVLAKRTRQQLEESRARVASDDRSEWFPAAKGLFGLLEADVYLTLAGFGQSYTAGFDGGVRRFLPRLLRPDAALLSSVELDFWNPTEEADAASAAVGRLAGANSLADALSGYYSQFGHVPLSGPLGLGALLQAWAASHPADDPWSGLWAWADDLQSPIARYHVCAALLANPGHVPAGAEDVLWGEIGDVVNDYPGESARTRWAEAWLLRDEVALHLGNYLECLLPGLPGERLMVMAWWLTERLCELLPPSPGLLKKIRETTLAGEVHRSSFMNYLTHPPVGRSSLRYMTRLARRVWSASIVCELGDFRWLLGRALPPEDVGRGIDAALLGLLVQSYPSRPVTAAARPVYAFERPLAPVVTCWAEAVADRTGEDHLDPAETLRRADGLLAAEAIPRIVEGLADEAKDDDVRRAHSLRQYAYLDSDAGPTVWGLLHQDDRWQAVLRNTGGEALGLVFEALTELQVQHGEPWPAALPHMFACAAEEADDEERRQTLFGMTFFASIHAGGVSAIDRLMHGPRRAEFAGFAGRWRDQLSPVLRVFTPWAAGRVRAALSNLSLDEVADDSLGRYRIGMRP